MVAQRTFDVARHDAREGTPDEEVSDLRVKHVLEAHVVLVEEGRAVLAAVVHDLDARRRLEERTQPALEGQLAQHEDVEQVRLRRCGHCARMRVHARVRWRRMPMGAWA